MEQFIGWRKLGAWGLVFGLVAAATYFGRDLSDNAVDLLKWVTLYFFGANAAEWLLKDISVQFGPKKPEPKP